MKNLKINSKAKLFAVLAILTISISASARLSKKLFPKKNSAPKENSQSTDTSSNSDTNTNKKGLNISISKKELDYVADKIFQNEAGGVKENLVYWNSGENFPSLGIGHFIWYKKGEIGIFDESFPPFIDYLKEKNIKLPKILEKNRYAPWKDAKELNSLKEKKDVEIQELTDFLYNTKDLQIDFIYKRMEASLEKMLEAAKNKENVRKQFYRMANSPNGLYPLIDYVNFKGEGIKSSESYNGEGWGLLQVLENMKGSQSGKEALKEFSDSAKFVLERRVKNSDPAKNEIKWLAGWSKRCDTYKQ